MASISHAGPNGMVTLKVTYENTTRRARMLLREMVPRVLEEHIRIFLNIPPDTKAIIERYSDSAGAFVVLDSNNVQVYKQLYRAAKAKSKLKLRVTAVDSSEKMIPKPVTVEDESEAFPSATHQPIEEMLQGVIEEPRSSLESVIDALATPPMPSLDILPSELELPIRVPLSKSYNSGLQYSLANCLNDQQQNAYTPDKHEQADESTATEAQHMDLSLSTCMKSPQFHPVACPVPYAVCCNNCEKTFSAVHYHCQTCDDGDFDLCQSCVDQAVTCHDEDHWLIKRTMVDGRLVTSSTERIAPKPKPAKDDFTKDVSSNDASMSPNTEVPILPRVPFEPAGTRWTCFSNMRTCNCCVRELPEHEFLHCATCEDFDLCQPCFSKDGHGHHPKHAFVPAVADTKMPDHITMKMSPGRNLVHHAICDGCDKYIAGVRHKCLECPDWDYCSECIPNAGFAHANHRFAPIYEPLADIQACLVAQPVHMGICCDGPLCSTAQGYPTYIRGVRYKCTVCHDLDFCANCEANPANEHNKTHPLIKFKTPVRHVSVTTTGEHQDGKRMALMGDRTNSLSKAIETFNLVDSNPMRAVQTADVKPKEPLVAKVKPEPETEIKQELKLEVKQKEITQDEKPTNELDLRAFFLCDTVTDGTSLPLNHVFEQTWVLRNEGKVVWPAGCSVKFVGGDYIGHVDSAHPAGISELVSASESTICYAPLAPGHQFPFTVLLRTPARAGKIISYWRLTTPDEYKFGQRLWCNVSVQMSSAEVQSMTTPAEEPKKEERVQSDSVMIFPKLDNESINAGMHKEVQVEPNMDEEKIGDSDSLGECVEDVEWDGSDGFMTDEEYDILDASDEEYLEEHQRKLLKK